MNVRGWFVCTLLIFWCYLFLPEQASACACCALDNQYWVHVGKPDSYEMSILEEMRFSDSAYLETEPEVTELWSLRGGLSGREWTLAFADGSRTGTLTLAAPTRMSSSRTDIHDGETSAGGGPLLYKEWRIEGKASGTGFFKAGNSSPSKYVLIFQGRGNNCDNSDDFTHWRLEITSRKATQVFLGRMVNRG